MDRQRAALGLERAVTLLGVEHPDARYLDCPTILHGDLSEPKRLNAVAVALRPPSPRSTPAHRSAQ